MSSQGKIHPKEYIEKYYSSKNIHNKLMSIAIKGKDKGASYKEEVYNRFNITQFASKSDYELFVEKNLAEGIKNSLKDKGLSKEEIAKELPNAIQETIDAGWRFYEHRDKLIGTGQYEDFRVYDYRDKYIVQLKNAGIDASYIKALENATPQQLKAIFSKPDAQKDSPRKTELPTIGFIYDVSPNSVQAEEIYEKLKIAFDFAGIEAVDTDDAREVETYARARVYHPYDNSTASRAYKRLKAVDKPQYDEDEGANELELFDSMLKSYKQGRLNIHTTKTNNIYIPFVGSSRSGTKNATFMKMFETYAKGKGVNIG